MKTLTHFCLICFLVLCTGKAAAAVLQADSPEHAAYGPAAEKFYLKGMKSYKEGRAAQAYAAWLKAAEMGHPKAQNNVGQAYLSGDGVEQNAEEAMRWFHLAAQAGIPQSQFQVAMQYIENERIEEGIALLRASAEQGCDDAECFYGSCWEEGLGVEQNDSLALYWYGRAAAKEQPFALTALGKRYLSGQGVAQDDRRAVEMFRKADEQGDAEASGLLAICYINGTGVEADLEKALTYIRRGAEGEDPDSQFLLGVYYQGDAPGAPIYPQAIHWWRLAAGQEHRAAADSLGMCYLRGTGVGQDPREALRLLTLAQDTTAQIECHRILAKQGDIESQYQLGCAYVDENTTFGERKKAGRLLLRKASDAGHVAARYKLGESLMAKEEDSFLSSLFSLSFYDYEVDEDFFDQDKEKGNGKGSDFEEGFRYLSSAAESNYAPAQYALSKHYFEGGKHIARDTLRAIKWLRKSAEGGFAEAQYRLGMLYYEGKGVVRSLSDAFRWWRQSADAGYGEALYTVGFCYNRGQGVTRDSIESFRYFLEGAEAGSANAQYELARCYKEGEGTRKNDKKAFEWFARAADKNVNARKMLAYCYATAEGTPRNRAAAAYWYRKAGNPQAADIMSSLIGKQTTAYDYVESKWDEKRKAFIDSTCTYTLVLASVDADNANYEELWIETPAKKKGKTTTYYADRIERVQIPILSADGTSTQISFVLLIARNEWRGGNEYGFVCNESILESISSNPAVRFSIPEVTITTPLGLAPGYLTAYTNYKKGFNQLGSQSYSYQNKVVHTQTVKGSHHDYTVRILEGQKNLYLRTPYYTTIEIANGPELIVQKINEVKAVFNTHFGTLANGYIRLITLESNSDNSQDEEWTIEDDELYAAILNIWENGQFEFEKENLVTYDVYSIRPKGKFHSKNESEEETRNFNLLPFFL